MHWFEGFLLLQFRCSSLTSEIIKFRFWFRSSFHHSYQIYFHTTQHQTTIEYKKVWADTLREYGASQQNWRNNVKHVRSQQTSPRMSNSLEIFWLDNAGNVLSPTYSCECVWVWKSFWKRSLDFDFRVVCGKRKWLHVVVPSIPAQRLNETLINAKLSFVVYPQLDSVSTTYYFSVMNV